MAVIEVMSPNADTIDASRTLDEVVTMMLRQNRRWAPVVDDMNYIGLLAVTDIAKIPPGDWPSMTARQIAHTDLLPVSPSDPVSLVAERLRSSDNEALAVTEGGRVIGVVTLRDLSNIEILLDRLNNEAT
jgi:CBS domain-containing protein